MTDSHTAHSRKLQLSGWLQSSGWAFDRLIPLSGDVSRRRYFRLLLDGRSTAIAVSYPPDMGSVCSNFLRSTALLDSVGVRVPAVLAAACDAGFALVEDLGSTSLFDLSGRDWSDLAPHVDVALTFVEAIQRLPLVEVERLNQPLGTDALAREIEFAWERLLDRREFGISGELRTRLADALETTCSHLGSEPLVPCHRDFMARNLMIDTRGSLAVIDHQDLRLGPRFYDLASLLNDSLFPARSEERLHRDREIGSEADLLLYRRCVVQRSLKAAATFVSFADQGDARHIPLVSPTLTRGAYHLEKLPEGGAFARELAARWHKLDLTKLAVSSR